MGFLDGYKESANAIDITNRAGFHQFPEHPDCLIKDHRPQEVQDADLKAMERIVADMHGQSWRDWLSDKFNPLLKEEKADMPTKKQMRQAMVNDSA